MYQRKQAAAAGTTTSKRKRRIAAGVGVASGGLVLLGGWQLWGADEQGGLPSLPTAPVAEAKPPARLAVEAPKGQAVRPDAPVTVRVANGKLARVSVLDDKGKAVPGKYTVDGAWTTADRLAYGTTYRVTSEAINADGKSSRFESAFTTLQPKKILKTDVTPYGNQKVGVGMPIIVRFTDDVTNRAEVEKHLEVVSSKPVVGSWRWVDDDEVHYRPQRYWPAHTHVRVKLGLGGVEAKRDMWGEADREVRFNIGHSMVSRVDAASLRMRVVQDGKLVRTIRVTTGKRGYTTRSGIRVVSERNPVEEMISPGVRPGQSGYYRLTVGYALRISNSGEFVHAAPWSVRSQGRQRVSHGCVGMSTRQAAWLFRRSQIGDVVEVVNTGRRLEPGNGWTQWNMSWAKWQQGSALKSSATPVEKVAQTPVTTATG